MAMTVDTAQAHLDAWLAADLAVTSGQAYQLGEISVTRAEVGRIRQQITYWQGVVEALTASAAGGTARTSLASFGTVQ